MNPDSTLAVTNTCPKDGVHLWWTEQGGVQCRVCPSEREEAPAITEFWDAIRQRLIIGFNIRAFDMRYLVQRSRYLRAVVPHSGLGSLQPRQFA